MDDLGADAILEYVYTHIYLPSRPPGAPTVTSFPGISSILSELAILQVTNDRRLQLPEKGNVLSQHGAVHCL